MSRDCIIVTDFGEDVVSGKRRRSRRRNRYIFSLLMVMEIVWKREDDDDGGGGGEDVVDNQHHHKGDGDDGSPNELRRQKSNKEETLSSVEMLNCAFDAADGRDGDNRTEYFGFRFTPRHYSSSGKRDHRTRFDNGWVYTHPSKRAFHLDKSFYKHLLELQFYHHQTH